MKMKAVFPVFAILLSVLAPVFAQAGTAAQGSGLLVAPSAAAYADLVNAAKRIVQDNPGLTGKTVVIFDAQAFGLIPTYQTSVQLMKDAMRGLCAVETPGLVAHALVPSLDIGGAASGLAALLQALSPAYTIQGQGLTFDNNALVAAFAKALQPGPVIVPAYLVPASPPLQPLACQAAPASDSLAAVWHAAAAEAGKLRDLLAAVPTAETARKKQLQDALDAFQKVRDTYLAVDKTSSLLGKLLGVETLALAFKDPEKVAVIDLKIDSVGIDSTTRTLLFWRKSTFSCNVMVHYFILSAKGAGTSFTLNLTNEDTVIVMTKDINQKGFATSAMPAGRIN
jgi:hypothetical protein